MAGSSILLCITLPWFLAVTWKFPSFPEYFILDQHLMRFAGRDVPGLRFHDQSPLFFLPIILGGAFPWSPYLAAPWRTLWREVRTEPLARFAWSWLLPSLAFFSISSGKLPTYVLPLFPPMALLVARRWDDIAAGSVSRLFSLGLSAVVLGAGIIASVVVILLVIFRGEENYFVLLDRRLVTILVVVAISFPAASFVALRTGNASRAFTVLVSMGVPVMLLGAFFKVNLDREASTEAIALHVKDARRPGEKVICAGEYLPLISFQLAEPIFVYGSESELVFGAANPEGCCDPLVDLDRLRSWVRGPDRVFVIIQEKKRQRLETKLGKSLYLLAKEGRHVLVSNASAPSTPGAPEDEE
jgi:4-amino-4-deoxy-L-arabinose transferase-like glycosyltransferase